MQVLLSPAELEVRIAALGRQLTEDYRDRPLTVVGVLQGSLVLLADLIRRIEIPHRLGVVQASSYRGTATSPGQLEVSGPPLPDLADRDVLLLDDIFDTGRTLACLTELIGRRRPRSLKTAVLLWKTARRAVELTPDYWGFEIPDVFVVGYGLDYNDDYRHLPYVAALEPADLESL